MTSAGKRLDIQGLRALAVLLVVGYHAHKTWLPGGYVGVDVFFVISGFLITGGLIREIVHKGEISWAGFYARRALRILPAAAVTIIATVILAWLLLPPIRRVGVGGDALASMFYVQNWRLADLSTDYLTGTQAPSPLQHFWSLAVEEQFYIVWPLLLIVATLPLKRFNAASAGARNRVRPLVLGAVAVVLVPSLCWSIYLTPVDTAAYFVTTTRLWELAVGAGLAAAASWLSRIPTVMGVVLGWAGLAAILAAAFAFDDSTQIPGYHALLPVLGAAGIIAGGLTAGSAGPVAILGRRPATLVGDISYSYYLWHWPLIIIALATFDQQDPSVVAVSTAALSLVPAWLSYKLVEQPCLGWRPRKGGTVRAGQTVGLLATAGSLLAALSLTSYTTSMPSEVAAAARALRDGSGIAGDAKYGAAILRDDPRGDPSGRPVDAFDLVVPPPEKARSAVSGCSAKVADSAFAACSYGDRDGDVQIALVGDSHAAQWGGAFDVIGRERGWRIDEFTRQSCPVATGMLTWSGKAYENCAAWNTELRDRLASAGYDLIVISSLDGPMADGSSLSEHMVEAWSNIMASSGSPMVVISHTPYMDFDVPDCVSANPDQLSRCTAPRAEADRGGAELNAAAEQLNLPVIDLFDAICPTRECASVIGSVIVYADTNHVTSYYIGSLVPRLRHEMDEVWPAPPGR
jgi:peptidoglycan/LPS O-acetylase OafA/YrhL